MKHPAVVWVGLPESFSDEWWLAGSFVMSLVLGFYCSSCSHPLPKEETSSLFLLHIQWLNNEEPGAQSKHNYNEEPRKDIRVNMFQFHFKFISSYKH